MSRNGRLNVASYALADNCITCESKRLHKFRACAWMAIVGEAEDGREGRGSATMRNKYFFYKRARGTGCTPTEARAMSRGLFRWIRG